MSIHTRKLAEKAIEDSRTQEDLPNLDSQERNFLTIMEGDSPAGQVGGLTVLCADLLETARRTDPAYEIARKGGVTVLEQ